MNIIELEKLSHSQEAITAAYVASIPLQVAGWMRYPAPTWDKPALVMMNSDKCVGGVNYSVNDDDRTMSVDFAWALPEHLVVLVSLLLRFRAKFRGGNYTRVGFTAHIDNVKMQKLIAALRLTPTSASYRIPL